jgi:parvulin-like peptidyl-prolyl isomerase
MTRRLRHLLWLILPALLPVTVPGSCPAKDSTVRDTIAKIADQYVITLPDLQAHVREHHYAYMYRKRPALAYEKALDDMIVSQLKRIDFFARGLQHDAALIQRIRRTVNEELVIRYSTTRYYEKHVNEGAVARAYRETGREVLFHQVVLAKPAGASRKEIDSLKSLAESIRRRIRRGEDAGRLANEFSRVPDGRSPSARQLLDWKMSFANDASFATFHLPVGEVRVLETGDSFIVVKIERVTSRELKPFDAVEEEVRKALETRYTAVSDAEFEREKKGLIDERKVKWNPDALKQIVRWSKTPMFFQTAYADTLRAAVARRGNMVVLEYGAVRVDLNEYLRLLSDVLTPGDRSLAGPDDAKKFLLEAVRTNLIANKAAALGLEKDVVIPGTANPILRRALVQLYDRREIEGHIPKPTDRDLREFYQANKDSLYYLPAKVNVLAVVDSRKPVLDGMKEQLKQQLPFEKLAREIQVKTYIRRRGGSLETYLGDEPPLLAESAFSLKVNEVGGPVEYQDPVKGKMYALVKCADLREGKQQTYDDVAGTVAKDYALYHWERIGRDVEDRLRRTYEVTIREEVLRRNLSSIGIVQE